MSVGRHTKGKVYREADFMAYLQSKNLSTSTQDAYCLSVHHFLLWYASDLLNCAKKDVLKYLEHLQNDKQQENITRKNALIAIDHYCTFLVKNGEIGSNPAALIKIRGTKKRTLHKTYSPEALTQLLDNYYLLFVQNFEEHCFASRSGGIPANQRTQSFLARNRNAVMLSLLIHQGAATNELQRIQLQDVDLTKATIKLTGGKKSDDRTIALHATQIGLLTHYIQHLRPQFLHYCNNDNGQLFLALPESGKKTTDSVTLMGTFKQLTTQIKSIDKTLTNLKQIRASVITHWIKTAGLRRAQYLAGHRYISSTENYIPNNLDGLIEDITKYNPF